MTPWHVPYQTMRLAHFQNEIVHFMMIYYLATYWGVLSIFNNTNSHQRVRGAGLNKQSLKFATETEPSFW